MATIDLGNVRDPLSAYPVGSIYLSVNSTSPASLFGGTWEQIKGRFLIGTGTPENNDDGTSPGNYNMSLGSKGGEKDHKLTVEELANHDHGAYMINKDTAVSAPNFAFNYQYTKETPLNGDTRSVGGNQPHNNMPPYLAVNMWKRVS